MVEHGNGVKSRRNKILLSYIKDPRWLKDARRDDSWRKWAQHQANTTNMSQLYANLLSRIRYECQVGSEYISILDFRMWSNQYHLDDYRGICEDGDINSIRYVRNDNGRVFKKKAGRFLHDVLMEHDFGKTLPEPVMKWLCEEFTQRWQTHASSHLPDYTLHVSDALEAFEDIYDSDRCKGDFGSCMVDDGYYYFYKNAVKSRAAWLEDNDGDIVARCIIYDDVELFDDENHRKIRIAERQYSTDCDDLLKRILVDKLIEAGHIDAYKKVGADCHSPRAFVWNDGTPCDVRMKISCDLDFDDELSYQDSFKWYNMSRREAYNFSRSGCYELDTTEGRLEEEGEWDSWHERYAENVVTVYYHGREYTCDEDNLEDFVYVEDENEYYHSDDVTYCTDIDDYVLEENAYYSDRLGEYYSDEDRMHDDEQEWYEDHGWVYSEYDGEWYEDADDVVRIRRASGYEETISKDSLASEFSEEELTYDEEEGIYVELEK